MEIDLLINFLKQAKEAGVENVYFWNDEEDYSVSQRQLYGPLERCLTFDGKTLGLNIFRKNG